MNNNTSSGAVTGHPVQWLAAGVDYMQTHNDYAFLKKRLLSFVTVLYVRHFPRNSGGIIVMTMSVLRFHFRIYWTESEIRSSSILIGWYRILPPRIYIATKYEIKHS